MTVAENGVFYCTDTAVFYWAFGQGEKEPAVIAGNAFVEGKEDGMGRRARFRRLQNLMLSDDSRYIYISDCKFNDSRYVRIDTLTDEVRTLSNQCLSYTKGCSQVCVCPAGDEAFFVFNGVDSGYDSESRTGPHRLHRVWVMKEAGCEGLRTWQTLDLTAVVQPLSFHLSDGTVLHFDVRILRARSEYFQKMLDSGCREASEGKVDLTSDTSIGQTSLEVLLRFVATGSFLSPSDSDMTMEQLFDVRSLADRYQLNELTEMVERQISDKLSETNVLICLQKVLGSGHKLESACWDFVESKRDEILEQSKDMLVRVIQECPELGAALLTRNLKRRRV
eukprot:gnl/MRDRNA2_/MRDRNA2_73684_c0_seq1.p1 gnl/MRDRNA2_/MRDRNA2_73684_c0~~gnl/MRDRNA2_/MRDRNA2_73684_c0_seq1.p1  ORF type:complete len:353 (+),score=55.92 gnl/MRDRNA2_/MRDRNA2_73684_c0_seq1:52-1059(+)